MINLKSSLNISFIVIFLFSLQSCLFNTDDDVIFPNKYDDLEEPIVCFADSGIAILYPQNQEFEILPNSMFNNSPVFKIDYSLNSNSLVFIDNYGFWVFLSPGSLNIYNIENSTMNIYPDLLFYRIWLSPNGELFLGVHGTDMLLEFREGLIISNLENEFSTDIINFINSEIDTTINAGNLISVKWINNTSFELGFAAYSGWNGTSKNYKYIIFEWNNMQLSIDYIFLSDVQIFYNNDRSKAYSYKGSILTYIDILEADTLLISLDDDISYTSYIAKTDDILIRVGNTTSTREYFIYSSVNSEIIELSPNAFILYTPSFSSSGTQFVMKATVEVVQKGIYVGENDGTIKVLFIGSQEMGIPSFLNGYEE